MNALVPVLLDNLGFPLYFCKRFVEKDNYFFVGGGGGAAQTGVLNYVVSHSTCSIYGLLIEDFYRK